MFKNNKKSKNSKISVLGKKIKFWFALWLFTISSILLISFLMLITVHSINKEYTGWTIKNDFSFLTIIFSDKIDILFSNPMIVKIGWFLLLFISPIITILIIIAILLIINNHISDKNADKKEKTKKKIMKKWRKKKL